MCNCGGGFIPFDKEEKKEKKEKKENKIKNDNKKKNKKNEKTIIDWKKQNKEIFKFF